jgi:hypothetical protein
MRWIRRLIALASFAAGGAAFLASAEWWRLSRLPFNEEGRFFDAGAGVVYQRQDALGCGVIALAALVGCAVTAVLCRRLGQRS